MGELLGKQIQPRDLAELAYEAGVTDAEDLVIAVAVSLAESQGFDRAYNDNLDSSGNVSSRDVGLWQINIPASAIGTQTEEDLYDHINNARAMFNLYRNRGFQPWVAFNTTIYLHDSYVGRATSGVGNFLGDVLLSKPVADKPDGTPYVHKFTTPINNFQFRLAGAVAGIELAKKTLGWTVPTKATVAKVQQELSEAHSIAKASLPE